MLKIQSEEVTEIGTPRAIPPPLSSVSRQLMHNEEIHKLRKPFVEKSIVSECTFLRVHNNGAYCLHVLTNLHI
jgi:hypothetical protein